MTSHDKGVDLYIYMDHVMICGQIVMRPSHISRGAWMEFWERIDQMEFLE